MLEKRVMGITERFSINKNELNSSLSRTRERRRPARLRANELMATEINRLYCNKTKQFVGILLLETVIKRARLHHDP